MTKKPAAAAGGRKRKPNAMTKKPAAAAGGRKRKPNAMTKKTAAAAGGRKHKPDAKQDTAAQPDTKPDVQPVAEPWATKPMVELKKWKTSYHEKDTGTDVMWRANLCGLEWDNETGEVEERWKWRPLVTPTAKDVDTGKDGGKGKGRGKGKGKGRDKAK